MASAHVYNVTDANFKTDVINCELPALVDFWAVWCGPCKQIAPTINGIADAYRDRLKVFKVDVDRNPIFAQQFRVSSIPTVIIFKKGQTVGRFDGVMSRSALEAEINKHL